MGLQHAEDIFAIPAPTSQELRTLEQFLLAADCASCNKAIHKGESYLVAGNPAVTWKFHLACWKKLPRAWRLGLDVYGGEDIRFSPENKL